MTISYSENMSDHEAGSESISRQAAQKRIDIAAQLHAELEALDEEPQPLLVQCTKDSKSLIQFLRYMGFNSHEDDDNNPPDSICHLNTADREGILAVVNQVVFNQYPKLDRKPNIRLVKMVLSEYVELREKYLPGADQLDWMLPNLHCISRKFFQVNVFTEYENHSPLVIIKVDGQGNDLGGNIARIVARALENPADGDHHNLFISLYNNTDPGSMEREWLLAEVSKHLQQARDSNDLSTLVGYEKLLDWLYMIVSLKQTNPPSLLNNELYDSLHKALRREYVHAICHPKADLTGMLPILLSAGLEEYYKGYAERREESGVELPPPLVKISIIDSARFQEKLAFHLSAVGSLQHLDELIWNHDLENLATAILAIKLRSCREELRGEIASQKLIIKKNRLLSKIFGVSNNI